MYLVPFEYVRKIWKIEQYVFTEIFAAKKIFYKNIFLIFLNFSTA